MKGIKISDQLTLPVDAVTQTFGMIARKGGGKTYGAQKLAEGMLDLGAQIVVLDPIGNWWALRVGIDGHAGYNLPVFGGLHGDIPLLPEAGVVVADAIIDTGTSAIVDVSQMRKAERKRFVADFCEQLFMLRKKAAAATHVFLEEAQVFCPQQCGPDERRMLGAVEDIVRLGRNFGLGATLISQRPQSVNKEVLNQVECLFLFQINGAHERKAILDWVAYKGMDVKNMVDSLPALKVGTAFVWSPQWLDVCKKIKVGAKKTLDASSTPKVGGTVRNRQLRPVEIHAISKAMEEVVKKAHADDPKALRQQIARLERDLKKGTVRHDDGPRIKELEKELRLARAEIDRLVAEAATAVGDIERARERLTGIRASGRMESARGLLPDEVPVPKSAPRARISATPAPKSQTNGLSIENMRRGAGPHRILSVLAQFHPKSCTARKVGLLADLAHGSGTFSTYLGRLRSAGMVYGERDQLGITEEGLVHLGDDWQPLPTGDALRAYWLSKVGGGGKRRMLEVLLEAYPSPLTPDELAERANLALSGTFSTYLGKLRTLELAQGKGKEIRAAPELFGDA